MARFLAPILSLLVMSSAYAADIQDAPIPESVNWIGIIVFLAITVGGGIWFFWRIWQNDKQAKSSDNKLKA